MTSTTARMLWTALLLALTGPLIVGLWGFSVDDAWIVSRVVENGLSSGTYAFNARGPRTDAITPLGFAELIAVLAPITGHGAFATARVIGLGAVAATGLFAAWCSLEGANGAPATPWQRTIPWAVGLAASPTWAAWAGAGLETPLVALLCTLGCALSERWADAGSGRIASGVVGAACLGLAVGWRPELGGFAFMTAIQLGRTAQRNLRPGGIFWVLTFVILAGLPAFLRTLWFGTPVPLAFVAKEPDGASGVRYVLGSLAFCGPLWLLWPLGRATDSRNRRWGLVAVAHGLCVLLAGGDWMPLYRLWVPVVPWLCAVAIRSFHPSRLGWTVVVLSGLSNALLLGVRGPAVRRVVSSREAMVQDSRPLLDGARVVAAVDIGWVGRATRADIVDLAGVTDPRVATLPGGHTSKHIAAGFFAARSVDTWIIRARDRAYVAGDPLESIDASYAVDARLLARASDLSFRGVGVIPLPFTSEQYIVARYDPSAGTAR